MGILPQNTTLGVLKIVEVYEFYDKPCLFSCENLSGQVFIAVWIDEAQEKDYWMYTSVSTDRFRRIISGEIELREAFSKNEDGFVYEICIYHEDDNAEVKIINCENIQEDQLPSECEYLGEDLRSLEIEKVKSKAIISRKAALNIAFSFPNVRSMEAPVNDLSTLLKSVQYLIDALGQTIKNQATVKGNIPDAILNQTKLVVTGTYPGSFGVEMISVFEPDLWGNSLAEDAIEFLFELIMIGKDAETLKAHLLRAKPRAASRYRIFLENLINAKVDVHTVWASFNPSKGGQIRLNLDDAKIILEIVSRIEEDEPKQYEIEGELVGVNKRTKSFEIWETQGERKKYSGKILSRALPAAETATLSNVYIATIQETTEVTPVTGEEKIKYQLAALRSI